MPGSNHFLYQRTTMSDFNPNESLFTDLTPEQAAIVEGGLQFQSLQLRCLKAGDGSDQLVAELNGVKSLGPRVMRRGSVANFLQNGNSGAPIKVQLRDQSDGNASLGRFNVLGTSDKPQKRSLKRIISGNGSRYEVIFTEFSRID
jgi:hypothetical protein